MSQTYRVPPPDPAPGGTRVSAEQRFNEHIGEVLDL